MSSFMPQPAALFPEELRHLHRTGTWLALLGFCLLLLGFVALGSPFVASLATVAVIGGILIAAGILHITNAVVARRWRGFGAHLLVGILEFVLGMLMLERPMEAAGAFTLMLAVAFLAGGLLRIAVAVIERFPGWPWVLLSGVVAFALGVMIWRRWPESAIWVIGTFVGIDLVLCGMTWLMLGLAARRARV
ncbi:MAG: HdeD family acid-resistance protein [Gemmataceae bacterium]